MCLAIREKGITGLLERKLDTAEAQLERYRKRSEALQKQVRLRETDDPLKSKVTEVGKSILSLRCLNWSWWFAGSFSSQRDVNLWHLPLNWPALSASRSTWDNIITPIPLSLQSHLFHLAPTLQRIKLHQLPHRQSSPTLQSPRLLHPQRLVKLLRCYRRHLAHLRRPCSPPTLPHTFLSRQCRVTNQPNIFGSRTKDTLLKWRLLLLRLRNWSTTSTLASQPACWKTRGSTLLQCWATVKPVAFRRNSRRPTWTTMAWRPSWREHELLRLMQPFQQVPRCSNNSSRQPLPGGPRCPHRGPRYRRLPRRWLTRLRFQVVDCRSSISQMKIWRKKEQLLSQLDASRAPLNPPKRNLLSNKQFSLINSNMNFIVAQCDSQCCPTTTSPWRGCQVDDTQRSS